MVGSIGMTLKLADLATYAGSELLSNVGLENESLALMLKSYGGSPLMLSLIARELAQGRATAEDLLGIKRPSTELSHFLARIVERLSPDAHRLLELVAVEHLAQVTEDISKLLNRVTAAKAREELISAGLVIDSGGKIRISHEAVRKCVLENLPKGATSTCR